jgi:2,3-bisphosphoglycerate-independent phosphoglycerate mutase
MNYKPVVLVILDGFGYREEKTHNAIAAADTPFIDSLWENYPHTLLSASGESLGLPEGQIGSSEIGHMTIGMGKIMDNDLVRIHKAVATGEFETNRTLGELFAHVTSHDSTLHLLGLISPGGVHSHQEHLHAVIRAAKKAGISKIAIHGFTDGRDTPPQSSVNFIKELEDVLETEGVGVIATIGGRYFGMDRDKNWDRVAKAEDALFLCKGNACRLKKPSLYLAEMHAEGHFDEHLEPAVFLDAGGQGVAIEKNDGIFFFNFRADRARQLTERLCERTQGQNIFLATMTEYDSSLPVRVVFPPEKIETTLAKEVSKAGLSQLHIAETEKYAHVTYFLNGGVEDAFPGEHRVMIESRKDIKTHDLAPEMKAPEITAAILAEIEKGVDFVAVNYANADVVGHTANAPAVKLAIEALDKELSRLVPTVTAMGGAVVITADHGNAELNVDPVTGVVHTAHTLNPVPVIITATVGDLKPHGTLADIAPSVLTLLGLPVPAAMTGRALYS